MPNVDDLSKVFESAPGTLVVPNPDLKPEKSTTFELNYKLNYSDEKSSFSSSIYLTQLTDVIVTRPFKFNGSDLVDYQEYPARFWPIKIYPQRASLDLRCMARHILPMI